VEANPVLPAVGLERVRSANDTTGCAGRVAAPVNLIQFFINTIMGRCMMHRSLAEQVSGPAKTTPAGRVAVPAGLSHAENGPPGGGMKD